MSIECGELSLLRRGKKRPLESAASMESTVGLADEQSGGNKLPRANQVAPSYLPNLECQPTASLVRQLIRLRPEVAGVRVRARLLEVPENNVAH